MSSFIGAEGCQYHANTCQFYRQHKGAAAGGGRPLVLCILLACIGMVLASLGPISFNISLSWPWRPNLGPMALWRPNLGPMAPHETCQGWDSLMAKMFPDLVAIFWHQLGVPCGHSGYVFAGFYGFCSEPGGLDHDFSSCERVAKGA